MVVELSRCAAAGGVACAGLHGGDARGELVAAVAAFDEALRLAPRAEWAAGAQDRAAAIRSRLGR